MQPKKLKWQGEVGSTAENYADAGSAISQPAISQPSASQPAKQEYLSNTNQCTDIHKFVHEYQLNRIRF